MELRGTDRVACSRQANDFPASLDRAYRARFIADDAGGRLPRGAERWSIRRSAVLVIAICGVLWSLILLLVSPFLR